MDAGDRSIARRSHNEIHCLADNRGRPVAIALTPGNTADISMAVPLLSASAPSRRLIADKAYDADSLRKWLGAKRINAVIPSTASRTVPYPSTVEPTNAATSSNGSSAG